MREAAVEVKTAYENGLKDLPPGIPPSERASLISPAEGVAGQPRDLTLVWNSVSDAPAYQLELWSSATGPTRVTTRETSYPFTELNQDEFYTWRVRGENIFGYGPWSAGRSFTTGNVSFTFENYAFSSFTVWRVTFLVGLRECIHASFSAISGVIFSSISNLSLKSLSVFPGNSS